MERTNSSINGSAASGGPSQKRAHQPAEVAEAEH